MKKLIIKSEQNKHKNGVGTLIKALAIITYIGGVLSGFEMESVLLIVSALVVGTMLLGFAEIIHLLQSINNQSYIVTEYDEEETKEEVLSNEEIEELLEQDEEDN